MTIENNYLHVLQRITFAAERSKRDSSEVKLVVVTKSQPVEKIRRVIEAGAKILGENYPEETLPKILEITNQTDLEWHMIGHLQRRKSGLVAEYFHVLQSLDSVRLAQKLETVLAAHDRTLPVLLEMNVGGENTKTGWPASDETLWHELLGEINKIRAYTHIRIKGLMAMPPWSDDPELSRPYFKKLRNLRDYLQRAFPKLDFSELSMGTSIDFEVAIEEGATFVRIGTAILGERTKA